MKIKIIQSYICIFIIIYICVYTNGKEYIETTKTNKCYKCLKENQVCQNIINDEPASISSKNDNEHINERDIIYKCIDGLNCISDISMPSMHPNRTSSCGKSNNYLEFCEPGRELSCGLSMWCDSHDDDVTSQCKGFRSLQFNEKCTSDSQCDSMECSGDKNGYCLENEFSCRPKYYWNGTHCSPTVNTGNYCNSNDQCSLFDTCDNNVCIEKHSLQKYNSCTSNSSCDISNQLICINGICDSYIKSTSSHCLNDGCNINEYCECKTLTCSTIKILNQECKSIENQLDQCIDQRCIYTRGYKSSDSCIMKYCGKLVCEFHLNCTNTPCGDNIEFCQSKDNYTPNNQAANFNNNSDHKEYGLSRSSTSTSSILKSTTKFIILLFCIILIIIINN